jgi:broad specificity phosphatase PhoE
MRLSQEGHRQACALAAFLAPRPLVAVYSSPMLRARKTAATIVAGRAELSRVRIDRDLNEIRTGWQGQPRTSLAGIDWDFYANPRDESDESIALIHARMRRWLDRVLRRHAGGEVVGVSHGDPILILVGDLRGLPLESRQLFPRPYIATASLFRLRFDAERQVREIDLFVPHAEMAGELEGLVPSKQNGRQRGAWGAQRPQPL